MNPTTDELIRELSIRRGTNIPPDSAAFQLAMTRLIATGNPVSAQQLADATGFPLSEVDEAFEQMQSGNNEFDDDGYLVGAALTQLPTVHRFRVNGVQLFAWCALDTLFLPAYLDATAAIESVCPITDEKISLTVTPTGIQSCSPTTTMLSIVVPSMVTECHSRSNFCGQIFFFRDQQAAQQYQHDHAGVAIVSTTDAYRIAHVVYIEPMIQHRH